MSDTPRHSIANLDLSEFYLKAYDAPISTDGDTTSLLEIVQGFNIRYFSIMVACSESKDFRNAFEKKPEKYVVGSPEETFPYQSDKGEEKTVNNLGYRLPDFSKVILDPSIGFTKIYFKDPGTGDKYNRANPPRDTDKDNVYLINEEMPLAQQAISFRRSDQQQRGESEVMPEGSQDATVVFKARFPQGNTVASTNIELHDRNTTGFQVNTRLNHLPIQKSDVDIIVALPYQMFTADLLATIQGSTAQDEEYEIILTSC